MAQYDNTNTGMARKNTERRPDKNDAIYRGSINADGKEFWLDIWINEVTKEGGKMPVGEKYLSLKLKPKEARGGSTQGSGQRTRDSAPAKTQPGKDFDDDIPF